VNDDPARRRQSNMAVFLALLLLAASRFCCFSKLTLLGSKVGIFLFYLLRFGSNTFMESFGPDLCPHLHLGISLFSLLYLRTLLGNSAPFLEVGLSSSASHLLFYYGLSCWALLLSFLLSGGLLVPPDVLVAVTRASPFSLCALNFWGILIPPLASYRSHSDVAEVRALPLSKPRAGGEVAASGAFLASGVSPFSTYRIA
jgi:hypothetical protein